MIYCIYLTPPGLQETEKLELLLCLFILQVELVVKNQPTSAGDLRLEFDPWIGKIPWRTEWQPTQVFLPGESPWTEEPGGLQSIELQRVGHD